jgi:putative endonuclease
MSITKIQIGKKGEDIAIEYLVNIGYTILERNYRTSHGEIDIIANFKDKLIFVEVKTRTVKSFGEPEESISNYKKNNIINSAEHYLREHYSDEISVDFEVIAIYGLKKPRIRHLKLIE